MIHLYKAIYTRADGKRLEEQKQIEGVDVAMQTNGKLGGCGRGDRLDFLELINRWNRIGSGENLSGTKCQYIAGESVR